MKIITGLHNTWILLKLFSVFNFTQKYSKYVEGHLTLNIERINKTASYLGLNISCVCCWCMWDGCWQMMPMIIIWQCWWWIWTMVATIATLIATPIGPGCAASFTFIPFGQFQNWGNSRERLQINVSHFHWIICGIVASIGVVICTIESNWLKHIPFNWNHFWQKLFCFLGYNLPWYKLFIVVPPHDLSKVKLLIDELSNFYQEFDHQRSKCSGKIMARTWQDYGKKVQCLLTAFATTKCGCCCRGYLIFAADGKGINVTGQGWSAGWLVQGWHKSTFFYQTVCWKCQLLPHLQSFLYIFFLFYWSENW